MLDIRKRDIRKKADQIRRNMRISNYGIMNLYKECESVGWKVIRYPLGENADLGFAMKKDKDIIILRIQVRDYLERFLHLRMK